MKTKAAASLKTFSFSATGSAQSLGALSEGNYVANRILLQCSTANTALIGDQTVQVAPIPANSTGRYLELRVSDVSAVWVKGSGTVYVVLELPEVSTVA